MVAITGGEYMRACADWSPLLCDRRANFAAPARIGMDICVYSKRISARQRLSPCAVTISEEVVILNLSDTARNQLAWNPAWPDLPRPKHGLWRTMTVSGFMVITDPGKCNPGWKSAAYGKLSPSRLDARDQIAFRDQI